MACVKLDPNANPDGCLTGFECRSKNSRLVAAKHRLKLALHLVETGQRCRFRTVADELSDPLRPGGDGGLKLVAHPYSLRRRVEDAFAAERTYTGQDVIERVRVYFIRQRALLEQVRDEVGDLVRDLTRP